MLVILMFRDVAWMSAKLLKALKKNGGIKIAEVLMNFLSTCVNPLHPCVYTVYVHEFSICDNQKGVNILVMPR